MPRRLTLYVSDAEAPILDRFRESGGNLSEMFRDYIHAWDRLETLRKECDRIQIKAPKGRVVEFLGTWVWARPKRPFRWSDLDPLEDVQCGVAHTRKGKFLHYIAEGDDGEPWYEVYDTIEEIENLAARQNTRNALSEKANHMADFLDI